MERRRPRLDPLRAEHVHERLALVLADRPPRRAEPSSVPDPIPELVEIPVELESLDELPPARRFARPHVVVVVAMVAIAVLVAGWAVFRARAVVVATPAAVVTAPASPTAGPSGAGSVSPSPAPTTIVVHVLGAVRHPGLVDLPEHARVADAIQAAGGLLSSAAPAELNLAQPVSDGQQIVIGTKRHPAGEVRDAGSAGSGGSPGAGGSGSGSGSTSSATLVDLNRATSTQLEGLPGVGPVTAGKIVTWRTQHGRFTRVEELQEVDGIGPKTYAQIAPHVRV